MTNKMIRWTHTQTTWQDAAEAARQAEDRRMFRAASMAWERARRLCPDKGLQAKFRTRELEASHRSVIEAERKMTLMAVKHTAPVSYSQLETFVSTDGLIVVNVALTATAKEVK